MQPQIDICSRIMGVGLYLIEFRIEIMIGFAWIIGFVAYLIQIYIRIIIF